MIWPSRASCRRIPRTPRASSFSTAVSPASAGAAGFLPEGPALGLSCSGLSVLKGGDNRAMVAQAVRGQAAQEGTRSPPWPRLLGPPTISAMPEPGRNCASSSWRSTVVDSAQGAKAGRRRAQGSNLPLAENEPHVRRTRRGCSEAERVSIPTFAAKDPDEPDARGLRRLAAASPGRDSLLGDRWLSGRSGAVQRRAGPRITGASGRRRRGCPGSVDARSALAPRWHLTWDRSHRTRRASPARNGGGSGHSGMMSASRMVPRRFRPSAGRAT